MKRVSYSSSFTTCKNKKLLTSGVIFAVNRYECFMENKNIIRTFCNSKLWKKKRHLASSKFYWFFQIKCRGIGWTPRYTEYQRVKRSINCGENYSINTRLNLKARFVWEKKKNTRISEISWLNVLWRTGSDFFPTDIFPHIFTHFFYDIYPRKN